MLAWFISLARTLYPNVVASGTLAWCNPNASMVYFPDPSAFLHTYWAAWRSNEDNLTSVNRKIETTPFPAANVL